MRTGDGSANAPARMSGDDAHAILQLTMYKRVLLKISGEALAAGRGFGIDAVFVQRIAGEIAAVHALGCEIGIVVGGGNFFRGVAQQAIDMDRVAADHMGMLSTVINAIALQDAIEKLGLFCRVMSAIEMHEVAEPYIRRRAMRHLEKRTRRRTRRRRSSTGSRIPTCSAATCA